MGEQVREMGEREKERKTTNVGSTKNIFIERKHDSIIYIYDEICQSI